MSEVVGKACSVTDTVAVLAVVQGEVAACV